MALGALLVGACGGQSEYPPGSVGDEGSGSSSGTNSSGSSGAAGSSSGGSSSSGSSSGSSPSPPVATYCSNSQAYNQECKVTDACQVALAADCDSYASQLSAQWIEAYNSCADVNSCDYGTVTNTAFQSCLSNAVQTMTPTAAQQKVAVDFCATCAESLKTTSAQCVADFFVGGEYPAGLGTTLFPYDDAVAQSVDSSCVSASGCDNFGTCAPRVAIAATEPAACSSR